MPSARCCLPHCLPDAVSGRRCLPDATSTRQSGRGVCQTPRLQTVWQWAVWQTASGRQHLADTVSGRWHLPDAVYQTVWQRCLPDAASADSLAEGCLADSIWQTQCLADSIWQTQCLADGICQMPSTRQSGKGLSGRRHLADTVSGRCRLPDGPMPDCLADTASASHGVYQTVSGRHSV